jgi:hypothetical protein
MSPWEFITPVLIGFSVSMLLRYYQIKEGTQTFDNRFYLFFLLRIILIVVITAVIMKLLNLGGIMHNVVNSAIWLAICAFLFWRTKVLSTAQKARKS